MAPNSLLRSPEQDANVVLNHEIYRFALSPLPSQARIGVKIPRERGR